ncbi:MAG: VanZ family protein, partial [Clostridia bacterium]|nr:VanZ family protein [Clostridia bacterium]
MTTERQIIMYPFDSSDGVILKSDLILNVLGFVPYGFLFGGINKKINSGLKLVIIFLTSAVFELIQYVFVIGYTDIKDLLCNTLGGLIGLILYWIFYVILKENGVAVLNRAVKFATLFVLLLIVVMMIYKI